MLEVLSSRTYRHLFLAQAIALVGTGLETIAVSLLAVDLAGANAGIVLGTALAIKMLAYIGIAPIASALAERLPRRAVLVQSGFGLTQTATAIALASFGAGSMLVALVLPKLLDRVPDRRAMLAGAALIAVCLLAGFVLATRYAVLLPLWYVMGLGYSLAQTPSGRLLRRSSGEADRPALFAAQFALSHACWLITYPLAGWLGAKFGLATSFVTLGAVAAAAVLLSIRLWPADDPVELLHRHDGLVEGHPHLASDAGTARATREHSHAYVIDDEHQRWPSR